MVSLIAAIRGLLLIISLLSGLWSAINGLQLKTNIDVYNNQVMLARAGEGDVTALPPGLLDYAATVLPGLLSVVTLFARSYFGKDSTIANVIEQAGKLVPLPQPKPSVAPDVALSTDAIRAMSLLSGPLAGAISPLAIAVEKKMSEQGLPVAIDLEVTWADGTSSMFMAGDPELLTADIEDDDQEVEDKRQAMIEDTADEVVARISPLLLKHQPAVAVQEPSNN